MEKLYYSFGHKPLCDHCSEPVEDMESPESPTYARSAKTYQIYDNMESDNFCGVQWVPLNVIPSVHQLFMVLSKIFYYPGRI